MNESNLIKLVRTRQKRIESFVCFNLLPCGVFPAIRRNRLFREWLRLPMNYVRIMELPLTLELLEAKKNHKIMDISSPKLLALYMSVMGYKNMTISDISDYFVDDFKQYLEVFHIKPDIKIFDAKTIPCEPNMFDRIFSISVLEHIPYKGDIEAVREAARILKPGGIFVFTLPAYKMYIEEWLRKPSFYWPSIINKEGFTFYHRRYDDASIRERFNNLGFNIEDVVYIAEYPIAEPVINENGMLLHNMYYFDDYIKTKATWKFLNKLAPKVPILSYLIHRFFSQKYHYLTRDGKDLNIRQVAVKLRKMTA